MLLIIASMPKKKDILKYPKVADTITLNDLMTSPCHTNTSLQVKCTKFNNIFTKLNGKSPHMHNLQ
jgi:hypothetical protein